MASSVFLQDPQGVVGPLTFTVELHTPGQAVILHLDGWQVEAEIQDEVVEKKKKWRRSKGLLLHTFSGLHSRIVQDTFFFLSILDSSRVASHGRNIRGHS